MALFQNTQKQATPQMFNVPGGVYLPQQQQQQQQMNVMAMNRPQGMTTPQYNPQQQMFAAQQQQRQQMFQVCQYDFTRCNLYFTLLYSHSYIFHYSVWN